MKLNSSQSIILSIALVLLMIGAVSVSGKPNPQPDIWVYVQGLEARIASLEAYKISSEAKLTELNSFKVAAETKITALEAKVSELELRVDALESIPSGLSSPDYDSGWRTISSGETVALLHNLGTQDIFVYLIGQYTYPEGHTTHQTFIGFDFNQGELRGLAWYTDPYDNAENIIKIQRGETDGAWNEFRVLVWKLPLYP